MPLSEATPGRREIHSRRVEMKAFERPDGLYEAEAHLLDTKPFEFPLLLAQEPVPAGEPIHDMWVRIVFDTDLTVRSAEAASDATPFDVCREATAGLAALVGLRLASGWTREVKERLRGPAGCAHVNELLVQLATAALQGIWGLQRVRGQLDDDKRRAYKIDSCYAYAAERKVVRALWPDHVPAARPPR